MSDDAEEIVLRSRNRAGIVADVIVEVRNVGETGIAIDAATAGQP